ncbi:hypothetical protein ACFL08_04325 [Patescibacteria group bacterium]
MKTKIPIKMERRTKTDLSFFRSIENSPTSMDVIANIPAREIGIARAGLLKNVSPPLYPDFTKR